jgi:hypothetical protein
MRTLELTDLECINGGTKAQFCAAFAIGGAAWAVGAAANLWNPPGLAVGLGLAAVGLYCAF